VSRGLARQVRKTILQEEKTECSISLTVDRKERGRSELGKKNYLIKRPSEAPSGELNSSISSPNELDFMGRETIREGEAEEKRSWGSEEESGIFGLPAIIKPSQEEHERPGQH